jgi:hypothetical protein
MSFRTVALAVLVLLADRADAGEFRSFSMSDGRTFVAEVLETQSDGIRVRTPQGQLTVPFSLLDDMSASDAAAYDLQPAWRVVVAPGPRQALLVAAAGQMSGVAVIAPPPSQIGDCLPTDVVCLSGTISGGWAWVVVHDPTTLTLTSAVSTGETQHVARAPTDGDLPAVLYTLLELTPPPVVRPPVAPPPAVAVAPPAPLSPSPSPSPSPSVDDVWSPERVARASLIPVPGLASLQQRDSARFGAALAVTLPVTALWIGATGSVAQSAPEHVALSVGGFYAVSVAVSQAMGAASRGRALSLVPVDGGAVVAVGVTR